MSAGDIHAVGIIGVVALTVANLATGICQPVESRVLRIRFGLFLILTFALIARSVLQSGTGPAVQIAVCLASGYLVLRHARNRRLANASASVIAIAMVALCFHHASLVHSPRFTGDPEGLERRNRAM